MTTPTAWHEAAARALDKLVPACPDCTPGGPHFGDCPNSKFEPIVERDEDWEDLSGPDNTAGSHQDWDVG